MPSPEDAILVARRLHDEVETHNIVERAKGMLAQRFGIDIATAFQILVDVTEHDAIGLTAVTRHVTTRSNNQALDDQLAQSNARLTC